MHIVIYSTKFFPDIGGLENVAFDLATEFTKRNHQVTVITGSEANTRDHFSFKIVRKASFFTGYKLIKQADILLQLNVSLKGLPIWLFTNTPLVISHQGEYPPTFLGNLKLFIANYVSRKNIGCSQYIADKLTNAQAIPNPFNHELFRNIIPIEQRKKDLVFLGRLVSDKGVNLLIEAVDRLKYYNLYPNLSIIGIGPEMVRLKAQIKKYNLEDRTCIQGSLTGESLVKEINRHKIMVVPSIWKEPFGIVALEGIACGCLVIGSADGGLAEAIGKIGLTFPNGSIEHLTETLRKVLMNFDEYYNYSLVNKEHHLQQHFRSRIANAYLTSLEKVCS